MRNLLPLLCIPVAISLSGCGSGGSSSSTTSPSLTLTVAANQSVHVGETKSLTFSAIDSDGRAVTLNAGDIYWQVTSGGDYLTFNQDRKALGIGVGTAKVTATYRGFTSAECDVTVLEYVLAHNNDNTITINGPAGAVPNGTTLTVETKTANEFTLPPGAGVFATGAAVSPASVTFIKPITLTFVLSTAVPTNQKLALYKSSNKAELTQVDNGSGGLLIATLSTDRLKASVTMKLFDADSYALIAIPN